MKHKENPIRHFVPSPAQFRAARAARGWSETLAAANANITVDQLRILEADPRGGEGLFQLEDTYRRAGIVFERLSGLDGSTDRVSWRIRGPIRQAGVVTAPPASPENDNIEQGGLRHIGGIVAYVMESIADKVVNRG